MQEESVYDQLKKLIGDDAMDCLSKAFGGLNIQMPKSPKDSHPIVLAVGVEAAKKMASTFGGEEIYIRKPGKRLLQERNKEIIRKYDKDGKTVQQLAIEYCLSMRTIARILNEQSLSAGHSLSCAKSAIRKAIRELPDTDLRITRLSTALEILENLNRKEIK